MKPRGDTLIRSFRSRWPQIAPSAYIDPASTVIGDVTIGEQASVWPGVVIRGDVHWIRIGARTNIQDGTIVHVMGDQYPTLIGDGVTVGHGAILHGCTIESRVLVGMGSILLNGVQVGAGSIIAAGTLVPERTVIPPGSLFMGALRVKHRRALSLEDIEGIDAYATRYVALAETYRHEPLAAQGISPGSARPPKS